LSVWHPKLRHPWTRHIGLDSFVMLYHIQRKQEKFTVALFSALVKVRTYMWRWLILFTNFGQIWERHRGNKVGDGISWHWGLMFCEWRYCCCEIRNKVSAEVQCYRITKKNMCGSRSEIWGSEQCTNLLVSPTLSPSS